jgi:hypothetical protein
VIAGAVLLAVVATLAGLLHVAASQLRSQIAHALGPRATLDATSLDWGGVELRGLHIAAAPGWPAKDELRAERVHIAPDLRSVWSGLTGGPWRVASIEVEGGYLSLHRRRDGRLHLLPALLDERKPSARAGTAPELVIGEVRLVDTVIELFDSSVRGGRTHKLRLEQVQAQAGPLHLPALEEPTQVDIHALLKGPRHDGRVTLQGELTPATRDAKLDAVAQGLDLVALQPYLLSVHEAGVRSGKLDLKLDATVKKMRLKAPGVVTLTGLELNTGGGPLATLAGVPRQTVLNAMGRDGRIEVHFTLEGRLDDPSFSINDNLATRIASGLAESLGVSVGGVVEGVGGMLKGLLGR